MNKHIGSNFDEFMKKEIKAFELMDEDDARLAAEAKGYIDGMEKAFELMGKLGEFYDANILIIDERASDAEKAEHKTKCKAQANACRHGQYLLNGTGNRQGDFKDEEELPW